MDIPVERTVGFLASEVFSFDIELPTAVEMTPGTWLADVVTVSMVVDRFDVGAVVFSVSFEAMVVECRDVKPSCDATATTSKVSFAATEGSNIVDESGIAPSIATILELSPVEVMLSTRAVTTLLVFPPES